MLCVFNSWLYCWMSPFCFTGCTVMKVVSMSIWFLTLTVSAKRNNSVPDCVFTFSFNKSCSFQLYNKSFKSAYLDLTVTFLSLCCVYFWDCTPFSKIGVQFLRMYSKFTDSENFETLTSKSIWVNVFIWMVLSVGFIFKCTLVLMWHLQLSAFDFKLQNLDTHDLRSKLFLGKYLIGCKFDRKPEDVKMWSM